MDKKQINSLKEVLKECETSLPLLNKKQKREVLDFIKSRSRVLARDDFYTFVRLCVQEIMPNPYTDGKHIHLYCQELERVEKGIVQGGRPKLQFFLPPGAMKSLILILFAAWCWGRHPDWRIIHVGHSIDFAKDNFGTRIQEILTSVVFKQIFPTFRLKMPLRKDYMKTSVGGEYYCTGAGAKIAGRRAQIAICDDIIDEQTAYSDTERTKICEWYVPGLRSRTLATGSAEIIVNTRWHILDISGYILQVDKKSQFPWRIVKIPAILDEEAAKLLDLPEGGSFWPEFQNMEYLLEMKNSNTPAKWNALYMQDPIIEEGNIIKKQWLEHIWDNEDLPEPESVIISVDTAFSEKERADYSAYTVWYVFKNEEKDPTGEMYQRNCVLLVDFDRGRWDFVDLKNKVLEINDIYKPDSIIIEQKASGQSLLQEFKRSQLPVRAYVPDRDKKSRLYAVTPFYEKGMVYLLDEEDYESSLIEYKKELTEFPGSANDDYVDCTSQALNWLKKIAELEHPTYTTLTDDDEDEYNKPRPSYWNTIESIKGKRV